MCHHHESCPALFCTQHLRWQQEAFDNLPVAVKNVKNGLLGSHMPRAALNASTPTLQATACGRPKSQLHLPTAVALAYSKTVAPASPAARSPDSMLLPSSMPPLLHASSWLMYIVAAPGCSWTDWGTAALGAW